MDTQIKVFGTQKGFLITAGNSSGEGICDSNLKHKYLKTDHNREQF
jgi:hypothetical protein